MANETVGLPETGTDVATDSPRYREAFETLHTELTAMPSAEVEHDLRLSPTATADLVEASVLKLAPFLPALGAIFGAALVAMIERLPLVARATKHLDVEVLRASPPGDLSPLFQLVEAAYERLMADARVLVVRGLFDEAEVAAARERLGYQAIVKSTLVLVSLFRSEWPKIEGKTLTTLAELDAAEQAAQRFATALLKREHDVERAPFVELRDRAMTRLLRDYDEARRALDYLRWHEEDADRYAPSPYATGRRRPRPITPETDAPAPTGDAPKDGPFSG